MSARPPKNCSFTNVPAQRKLNLSVSLFNPKTFSGQKLTLAADYIFLFPSFNRKRCLTRKWLLMLVQTNCNAQAAAGSLTGLQTFHGLVGSYETFLQHTFSPRFPEKGISQSIPGSFSSKKFQLFSKDKNGPLFRKN